jgi:hypothetical protein
MANGLTNAAARPKLRPLEANDETERLSKGRGGYGDGDRWTGDRIGRTF